MSPSNIRNLVASALPKNSSFLDLKLSKLTSSGDNYGSILLSVDVTIKNENQEESHLHLVAKKVPENKLIQEMFNCERTFPNEIGFYQKITPCLKQYQKEHGSANSLNFFPDFYAATSRKIDQNSVLLIKNIKTEGFDNIDRTVGFSLPQANCILEKMAELHSTVIALKIQKPAVFEKDLLRFFQEYDVFVMDNEGNNTTIRDILDIINDDETCRKHLDIIEDILKKSSIIFSKKNVKKAFSNPLSTLVHSDLWANNIMVKILDNNIYDVKFVDYQLYEYSSLTRDVIFFIFTSISVEILELNLDNLLEFYYETFISYLKKYKVNTNIASYADFLEDIKIMLKKYELFHIFMMLPPIYATARDVKDVEQIDMDNFIFHNYKVTEKHREKACFIIKECLKRGWLK